MTDGEGGRERETNPIMNWWFIDPGRRASEVNPTDRNSFISLVSPLMGLSDLQLGENPTGQAVTKCCDPPSIVFNRWNFEIHSRDLKG